MVCRFGDPVDVIESHQRENQTAKEKGTARLKVTAEYNICRTP